MALQQTDKTADFLDFPRGDKEFRLNISRNTLLAFLFSIVLHGFILFFVVPKLQQKPIPSATTIQVTLAPKAVSPEPVLPIIEPEIKATPEPKVITKKPTEKPSKKPAKSTAKDFTVPETMAVQKPDASQPKPNDKPTEKPSDVSDDMFALVNRNRAKREAENAEATRENAQAVAAEQPLSEEAKRDARIAENLKGNTNGIFEIKRLESKSASFSFKGWTDYSNVKLKFYEVEAKNGDDIKLVVIRRIIVIIREHYQEDFPWESHRLGRTITKSARLQDNAELESFLMQEFFENGAKTF